MKKNEFELNINNLKNQQNNELLTDKIANNEKLKQEKQEMINSSKEYIFYMEKALKQAKKKLSFSSVLLFCGSLMLLSLGIAGIFKNSNKSYTPLLDFKNAEIYKNKYEYIKTCKTEDMVEKGYFNEDILNTYEALLNGKDSKLFADEFSERKLLLFATMKVIKEKEPEKYSVIKESVESGNLNLGVLGSVLLVEGIGFGIIGVILVKEFSGEKKEIEKFLKKAIKILEEEEKDLNKLSEIC
jgi:hypothetical protein